MHVADREMIAVAKAHADRVGAARSRGRHGSDGGRRPADPRPAVGLAPCPALDPVAHRRPEIVPHGDMHHAHRPARRRWDDLDEIGAVKVTAAIAVARHDPIDARSDDKARHHARHHRRTQHDDRGATTLQRAPAHRSGRQTARPQRLERPGQRPGEHVCFQPHHRLAPTASGHRITCGTHASCHVSMARIVFGEKQELSGKPPGSGVVNPVEDPLIRVPSPSPRATNRPNCEGVIVKDVICRGPQRATRHSSNNKT